MEDEIFGPILPVLEFEELDEVVSLVNKGSKPLALYFFSNDGYRQKKLMEDISF